MLHIKQDVMKPYFLPGIPSNESTMAQYRETAFGRWFWMGKGEQCNHSAARCGIEGCTLTEAVSTAVAGSTLDRLHGSLGLSLHLLLNAMETDIFQVLSILEIPLQ